MDKILNQEEIDELLRAARNRPAEARVSGPAPERAVAFAFGKGGGITSQQLGALNQLHETFARNLTQRLSAYLRAIFEITLVSAEQLPFTDFLQQIGEKSFLASLHVQPLNSTALVELDLQIAYPIIDLLLGGDGSGAHPNRDLTEIEDLLVQDVLRIVFQELQIVWENLVSVKFELEQRQQHAQVLRLLPPSERLLAITFEVLICGIRANISFAFPASVSGALLRKISELSLIRKRHAAVEYVAERRRRLGECQYVMELTLPECKVPVEALLRLEPGGMLMLRQKIEEPILLGVVGQHLFAAYPVRSRNARGALIESLLTLTAPPVKEAV